MTDELRQKLTERFDTIMKESNLDGNNKQLDAAVYDAMLKSYLAGAEVMLKELTQK